MSRPNADESVYRAVAHPLRRRILDLLRTRPRAAAELVDAFRIPHQTMSHHLRILRTSGLLHQRRVGRQREYQVNAAQLREIYRWTAEYQDYWSGSARR